MSTSDPSLSPPPGRLGVPFFGETFEFLGDPFAFVEARFRRHGNVFKTRVMGDTVVCFVGPEAFTFFSDERYFTRASANPPHFQELLHPDAAPFLEGPRQKERRRALLHAFTPAALAGYQPTIERVMERHLEKWAAAGGEVRGVDALGALCFAVANSLFAGADPDADDAQTAAVFDAVLAGVFAMPVKLPFTTYGKALRARDRLRAVIAQAVSAYRPGTADHALQRLIEASADDGTPLLSRDEVAIETFHFFVAAYAGLQAALCNLCLALSQHPDVARAARAEVQSVAPTGPVGDARRRLAFIDRVGREVRRFYPIVATTFFARVKEDCAFGGYRLERGWKAMGALHSAMRDARTFTRPERFDPDRFSPERAEDRRAPNSYVPHGGGPMDGHRCAGEALADVLLVTFAALALRRYTWELPPQDLGMRLAGLAPLPRDGLRMVFRRA
jgi:cytochrome P450